LVFIIAFDSIRKEALYNILIYFGAPVKEVRFIKMCLNKIYCEVQIGENLSDNDLKKGDALSPLLLNFTLANQVGLKLNGTHQLLVYADEVNLL
jgi:hypothetical protein